MSDRIREAMNLFCATEREQTWKVVCLTTRIRPDNR